LNKAVDFSPDTTGLNYKCVGIGLCTIVLIIIGWKKVTESMNPSIHLNLENLRQRKPKTRAGEFSHLIISFIAIMMIIIQPISLYEAKWLLL
jgi:hypothetical protein